MSARSARDRCEDHGVSVDPVYRKDVYKGTAEYYDRFRPNYPSALLRDLLARVSIDGQGRLLDLACGTGQVACALAGDFAEVWAVDQEDEFVEFGRAKSQSSGLANITWVTASAEEVEPRGRFELVTIGNAFHRLRRQLVAQRLAPSLTPSGCIALLWGETPDRGDQPWQQVMADTMRRWKQRVGAQDRVPGNWELLIDQDPHDRVLQRAGYLYEGRFEFSTTHRWTIESLVGFVYSTSFSAVRPSKAISKTSRAISASGLATATRRATSMKKPASVTTSLEVRHRGSLAEPWYKAAGWLDVSVDEQVSPTAGKVSA